MGTRFRYLYESSNCFFITTTINDWLELLIDEKYFKQLDESINFVCKKYKADIIAYVWMKNHIHFIIFFNEEIKLPELMRDFKKYTGRYIRVLIQDDNRLVVLEKLVYNRRTQVFKVWRDRYDAVMINSANVLYTKIEYIHNNPVRKGYVSQACDWKYSSAGYYIDGKMTGVKLRNAGEII